MFEEYLKSPDKLWLVGDANQIMADWKLISNGERCANRFLPLFDCGRLIESFQRNKSETSDTRRIVSETSTSVLLGATFNVAGRTTPTLDAGLAIQEFLKKQHKRSSRA
jgi:hypothetical protein